MGSKLSMISVEGVIVYGEQEVARDSREEAASWGQKGQALKKKKEPRKEERPNTQMYYPFKKCYFCPQSIVWFHDAITRLRHENRVPFANRENVIHSLQNGTPNLISITLITL